MNKILLYALIFAAGIIVSFFLFKGCGDKKKPTDNSTNNIEVIDDTLKVIEQDYKNLIVQKETIIMDLENAVKELRDKASKGSTNAAKLASQIEDKNNEIKRLGGEVQSLQFLIATMKVKDTAPIIEIPNEDTTKLPSYYTVFRDSSEWYKATVVFDLIQGQGSLNLVARDEYTLIDYTDKNGVSYWQVQNANPHVNYEPGSNLFRRPTPKTKPLKKNLLAGLYGRSTDGRVLYSGLYGRRFLKHGKLFIQGIYSEGEIGALGGLGVEF